MAYRALLIAEFLKPTSHCDRQKTIPAVHVHNRAVHLLVTGCYLMRSILVEDGGGNPNMGLRDTNKGQK